MCSCVLTSALPPCSSLGPVGRQKPQRELNKGSLIQGLTAYDKRVTVGSRETVCFPGAEGACPREDERPEIPGSVEKAGFSPWHDREARPEQAREFWASRRLPSAGQVRRSRSGASNMGEQRRSGCWLGGKRPSEPGSQAGALVSMSTWLLKGYGQAKASSLRETRFWAVTGPHFTSRPHIHTTSPCARDSREPLPPCTVPPASLLRKLNVTYPSEKCLRCHRSPQSIYHRESAFGAERQ